MRYLNELGVSEFLHDGSLLEEVVWRHGAVLEGLHSDRGGAVPHARPYIAKLSRPKLLVQLDRLPRNLPLHNGVEKDSDI